MFDVEHDGSRPPATSSKGCVLFATMEFYPTNPGGAGILVRHTVQLLLEQGFTVVLLFDGGRAEFEQLVNADRLGIPLAHRLFSYLIDDLCDDLTILPDTYPDVAVVKSLRLDHAICKLTQVHDIDLIELYDYCGHGFHYLSRPAYERPPVAIRLHNTIELMERKTRARLVPERLWLYAMERAQLALADVVLAPGKEYYERDVKPLYPTLTADRVLISPPVHMPVGEVEYDREARNVAFYGRLSTLKGLDTFLRAASLALGDPVFAGWLGHFVIIGPEDHATTALSIDELSALISRDQVDRFEFTGRLKRDALLEQLQHVAFACFPNRVEAFCYAAHELHTAGIPLIVNRIAAFQDGFEDGVSAIFFDGTALDLAERMKCLARDAVLRIALSDYGKRRAGDYWVNHYPEHLSWLKQQRANTDKYARLIGSVIVLSSGDRQSANRTVANLSSLPLRPFVLELEDEGELHFAGSRWRGTAARSDAQGPVGLQMVGEACLFVRTDDRIEPEWVAVALRVLAQNPQVGAVGGWIQRYADIELMSCIYVPELARLDEPGLGVLLRVGTGQTLAEYLHGWSGQSECSYLLAHRAAGRVAVELPQLAVDTRGAIDLPTVPDVGAAVDFDRSSREFLTLMRSADGNGRSGSKLADNDPDVRATTVSPSLIVVRKQIGDSEELWVQRIRRDDHILDLDCSAVMWRGSGWTKIPAPNAPAGVQMTRNGSIRFHARGRTGMELLFGPFCGTCEIVHRGRIHIIDLKQPAVQSCLIWLDELGGEAWSRQGSRRAVSRAAAVALKPRHAALKSEKLSLIAVAPGGDFSIADMLRLRAGCCVLTPDELELVEGGAATRGIGYAREVLQAADCRRVAIDATVPCGVELAEQVLRSDASIQVIGLLGEKRTLGIGGAVATYRTIGPWLRLTNRFPAQLSFVSTSQALIGLAARCGVRAFAIPPQLPALGAVDYGGSGETEVVIIGGTATVANTAHMITAVAHARRTGLAINRLWLQADDSLGMTIAEVFDAAPEIRRYDDLDVAFGGKGQRRIALHVFPDDAELPEAAARALTAGALPILGPASAFTHCADFHDALSITYWEDALAIAKALIRTWERFDRLAAIYNGFRQAQQEVAEGRLGALIVGSDDAERRLEHS